MLKGERALTLLVECSEVQLVAPLELLKFPQKSRSKVRLVLLLGYNLIQKPRNKLNYFTVK
jgi:hypothetical protein